MRLRSLLSRFAGLFVALPMLLPLEGLALAHAAAGPAGPTVADQVARVEADARAADRAAGEAGARSDLAPPSFGSRGSVRLAMATLRSEAAGLPHGLPDLASRAEAADGESDPAADQALKMTIVYGAVAIGCFSFAVVFIPVGAVYFFSAVAAAANGQNPGFQATYPMFFIGIALLVPGFIFLSKGLDQLRLYRSLTATLDRVHDGPRFAGLARPIREFAAPGDLVLFAF